MTTALSYDAVGQTHVADERWTSAPEGYRRHEQTTRLGDGEQLWTEASTAVMQWSVKTRSGFAVLSEPGEDLRVRQGQDRTLVASLGLLKLWEPVTVVAIIDEPNRCGFAYGTRDGHPVSGEEAFIVHRTPDGAVWLTLRSLTRPAKGTWRFAFPAALVAQRWYRFRYARSLRTLPTPA
ncbi:MULTISPECIES: DUF1990 family protein [unclassified Nocardioides]|uniref:DUF1990 family protein n=1 Tax=unclassified Nocardioides TaxID=2615069 RepID=UPI000700499C|nr:MULTISPECIES: DUF1990 domain-containing protein [unclassified Nocardioides]KRA32827.1 hypothetical protein ASD81_12240 [Nocardioides sp. Root614]KRA89481.1 hypothetical protein ASD84_12505 [Nocardioides sp. Root682]